MSHANSTTHTCLLRRLALLVGSLLLIVASVGLLPTNAHAQGTEATNTNADRKPDRVIWLINYTGDDPQAKKLVPSAPALFKKIVGDDEQIVATKHAQLWRSLSKTGGQMPDCLSGLKRCANPTAAALQSLGASALVVAHVDRVGKLLTLDMRLHDRGGRVTMVESFKARLATDVDDTVFQSTLESILTRAVKKAIGGSGTLEIVSTPPGATVTISGVPIGETPLQTKLPIGAVNLEVSLEHHAPFRTSARVKPGVTTLLEPKLEAMIASLKIETEPVPSRIFLNNVDAGGSGDELTVVPGTYVMEIKAPGYRTRRETLTIAPNERRMLSLALKVDRPEIRVTRYGEVSSESIYARRFYARVGYEYASLVTGLEGASGTGLTLPDLSSPTATSNVRPEFSYNGLGVDAGYMWGDVGINALGVSLYTSGDTHNVDVNLGSDEPQPLTLTNFTRYEFRPGQLVLRKPFKNLFAQMEAGLGYAYTSFDAETPTDSIELSRHEWFWRLGVHGEYYFASWWYGHATLAAQRLLDHDDTDT